MSRLKDQGISRGGRLEKRNHIPERNVFTLE